MMSIPTLWLDGVNLGEMEGFLVCYPHYLQFQWDRSLGVWGYSGTRRDGLAVVTAAHQYSPPPCFLPHKTVALQKISQQMISNSGSPFLSGTGNDAGGTAAIQTEWGGEGRGGVFSCCFGREWKIGRILAEYGWDETCSYLINLPITMSHTVGYMHTPHNMRTNPKSKHSCSQMLFPSST